MKYYDLQISSNNEVIGSFPQVRELTVDYQEAQASQFAKIRSWNSEEDYPRMDCFELHAQAKFTDVLENSFTSPSYALTLSLKAFELCSNFRLLNTTAVDALVHQDGRSVPYKFLWYYVCKDYIDFSRSYFSKYNVTRMEFLKECEVKDAEDFFQKNMASLLENFEEKLHPRVLTFTEPFDLASMTGFSTHLLCSENLREAIEMAGLTAFEFREIDYEIRF